MKNIEKFEDHINESSEDKENKKMLQNLRTELNICKKCLSQIDYKINHMKRGTYDYGEIAEGLLYDIKDMIQDCNNRLKQIK